MLKFMFMGSTLLLGSMAFAQSNNFDLDEFESDIKGGIKEEKAKEEADAQKANAVFIPRDEKEYWEKGNNCIRSAYLVPAISGMAHLKGIRTEGCLFGASKRSELFGYRMTEYLNTDQVISGITNTELCIFAKKFRIKTIFKLRFDQSIPERINCLLAL